MSRNSAYARLEAGRPEAPAAEPQYNWADDFTRLLKEFGGVAVIVMVRAKVINDHQGDVFIIAAAIAAVVSIINFASPSSAFNPAFVLYSWFEDVCEEFAKGSLKWSYVLAKTFIAVVVMASMFAGGVVGAEIAKTYITETSFVGQATPPVGASARDVVFNLWWVCFLYGFAMLSISARSRSRVISSEAASQKWILRDYVRPTAEGLCMFVGEVCLYKNIGASLNLGVTFGAAAVSGDAYMLQVSCNQQSFNNFDRISCFS